MEKMKIEIWSDIACPFCYIGKRKFDQALSQFIHRDKIQVIWKSFQLNPHIKTNTEISIHEYLATHKGMTVEEAKNMNRQVGQLAEQVGITFNSDQQIVANTFEAHLLSHFAKEYDKQNEAKELLFRSYFTDGKNVDDNQTLLSIVEELGLEPAAWIASLENNVYEKDVFDDQNEAKELGIQGVPFFVFNRSYAISGAQETSAFLEAIQTSFGKWNDQ